MYRLFEGLESFKSQATQIKKCLLWLTIGYLFIGFHQVLEYFAILFEDEVIYKSGLIFSVSAMIFNIKASESFFQKKLGSGVSLFLIILCGFHILTREMSFSNQHFYVRGESHFIWGALWMILFLYWNFIHLFSLKHFENNTKKWVLLFPFASLNLSFILSAFYCYSIGLYQNINDYNNLVQACGGLLSNFEIVFDAPSIWCVFATLQGPCICFYTRSILQKKIPLSSVVTYRMKAVLFSIVSVAIIFLSLPLFSSLSYKMIVK